MLYAKYVLKLSDLPTCKCGCGKGVRFYGWTQGFSKYSTKCRPSSWLKGKTKADPRVAKLALSSSQTLKRRYAAGEIVCATKGKKLDKDTRSKIGTSIKAAHRSGKWVPWRKGSPDRKEFLDANVKISNTLKRRFAAEEITVWHKGLSKETEPKLIAWCESHSEKLKERYVNGFKTWVDGLTNDTDDRLLAKSIKLRKHRDVIIKTLESYGWLEIIDVPEDPRPGNECTVCVKCKKCNTLQKTTFSNVKSICRACHPNCSIPQREIAKWLEDNTNLPVILNDRDVISPYEIDILIPGRLGIEFNGLFYHSNIDDQGYHQKKSDLVSELGLQLFHIFEDEWRDKREIIKSMLIHKLGLSRDKIYARNCEIKSVQTKDRREFFEATHIDGDVRAKFALGLFSPGGDLVALASFRRPFHQKWGKYLELARFSCKKNTAVVGAYSRLVHEANRLVKMPIMTYVDHRFGFDANRFEKMGFSFVKNTKPRFWWTDKIKRYDRFVCKANKSAGITQKSAAEALGYREIYGCTNSIFTYGDVSD